MDAVELLLSDARGVYIPQNFCEIFDVAQWGLDPDSWAVETCLSGPETEFYWDAWDEILNKATYKKENCIGEYSLYPIS